MESTYRKEAENMAKTLKEKIKREKDRVVDLKAALEAKDQELLGASL